MLFIFFVFFSGRKTNLEVRESKEKGIYIGDVTEQFCTEGEDFMKMLRLGDLNRQVSATGFDIIFY